MSEDTASSQALAAEVTLVEGVTAEGLSTRTCLEAAAHAVADLVRKLAETVNRVFVRGSGEPVLALETAGRPACANGVGVVRINALLVVLRCVELSIIAIFQSRQDAVDDHCTPCQTAPSSPWIRLRTRQPEQSSEKIPVRAGAIYLP